jgi:antitoxin ParD1/3/4
MDPDLGKHYEEFIAAQVKSGRYGSAADVLRDGLRHLENNMASEGLSSEALGQLVDEARLNGQSSPADEVFDRLEAKYRHMISGKSS